jgi:hypothetical protein
VAVVRSPVSRNRSLVRAVNRVAVASRNPANSSKSPDAKAASKADNRISVKYYSSVRSLSPGSAGGFFYWIAMRDERRSSYKRLSIDAAFRSMKAHGHPFSVTVDALIGARFPPTLGRQ